MELSRRFARHAHPAAGVAIAGVLAAAGAAQGDVVDLTVAKSSGVINLARFETADFRPAGTGFIDPFVRIQRNGTEQGYNTSGRPVAFDEHTDPNYTRNLQLGEMGRRVVEGTEYFEFLLDINQVNSEGGSLLSLDKVQIYLSNQGSKTTSNIASLGQLVYDMDMGGDNWVRMDYDLGSGSGQGDMRMLVPTSLFGNAGPDTFVYLYSMFGINHRSNDGFEEWKVNTTVIPLPPAVWLGAAGLGFVAFRRVASRRRAED